MTRLANLAYFAMTDGMKPEDREAIDELLMEAPMGDDAHGIPVWAQGDEDLEYSVDDLAALGIRPPA